jgi:uncharacterized damage-inducible protein DinB
MPIDSSTRGDRQLSKLLGHLEWADARVLDSLRAMPHPDARALELYAHVLGAEETWLSRMLERDARIGVWPTLSLHEAATLAAENAAGFRAFVEERTAEQLQERVKYLNSLGMPFESALEDMLLQVVLHGCYHRGQIALLVRGAGGEPSPTDYIAFARGAPAATRQPAR